MIGVAFALEGTLVRTPPDFEADVLEAVRAQTGADGAKIVAALDAREPTTEQRNYAAAFRQTAARLIPRRISLQPGARDLLAVLHELSMPTAIFGNGYSESVYAACETLGFRGTVLPGEDFKAALPSPGAFGAIATALRLPSDRIWFVTRDRVEFHTARAFGFETIFIASDDDLAGVLDVLREPYTEALLVLRYTMRTALEWRPGHAMEPWKPI